MRTRFALAALLAAASLASAEYRDLPANVQANLKAIAKYPKASSILLWCGETYTLRGDGAQVYEWHSFRYLPDEAARDNYGDPRIAYVEGRQQLEILAARAYTEDGRKIESTPNNAFNPVVPDGLDLAPDFSAFRQMVVTLLGLENGCISEFHYRLTTSKPLMPWMEGRVYFREDVPTIARELVIEVPVGTVLTYEGDRGAPDPSVDGTIYTWKAGEQRGYLPEDLGGHRMLLPNVSFTTVKDWARIQSELRTRIEQATKDNVSLPFSLSKALLGVTSEEHRLQTIQTWVRERFKLLSFGHPDFVMSLRPVKEILESGYGNSLEMAVLVSQLAAQAGLSARPMPWFVPEPVVPSLNEWAGVLLDVRAGEGNRFICDPLRPRKEFTGANLIGGWLFPLDKAGDAPTAYTCKVKTPALHLSLVLEDVSKDTLQGHGTLAAIGEWGIYEIVRSDGPSAYLSKLIHLKGLSIREATVERLEPPDPVCRVVVDFTFSASALDTVDGHPLLPMAMLDFTPFVDRAPLGLPAREFAQEVRMPGEITLHVEAVCPVDWTVDQRPGGGSQRWDWSEGIITSSVEAVFEHADSAKVKTAKKAAAVKEPVCLDKRVVFERTLKLVRNWVAPDGWAGFRDWMIAAGPRPNNVVVFGKK